MASALRVRVRVALPAWLYRGSNGLVDDWLRSQIELLCMHLPAFAAEWASAVEASPLAVEASQMAVEAAPIAAQASPIAGEAAIRGNSMNFDENR